MKTANVLAIENAYAKLDTISDLNSGGCGVAAYAMLKWIEQEFPKAKAIPVFLYNDSYHYNRNKANFDQAEPIEAASHVVLRVGRKYYDSEGVYHPKDIRKEYPYRITTTKEQLLDSVNNGGNWSHWFNRRKGKRSMQILLKIRLREFEP